MNSFHRFIARLCAMLFVLFFCSTAFGGGFKVEVCHYPPDDPDNFRTIRINENALSAHLEHFDYEGPCEDVPPVDPPQDVCSCWTAERLLELGTPQGFVNDTIPDRSYITFENDVNADLSAVCSGYSCAEAGLQCVIVDAVHPELSYSADIETVEDSACRSLLTAYWESVNP